MDMSQGQKATFKVIVHGVLMAGLLGFVNGAGTMSHMSHGFSGWPPPSLSLI